MYSRKDAAFAPALRQIGGTENYARLYRFSTKVGTDPDQLRWPGDRIRFDAFELFLSRPYIARNGAVNSLREEVASIFIVVSGGAICMTNLSRCLTDTLAELLDFILLSLVILLPFCAFSSFCLRIGVVVSLISFEMVIVLVDLENLIDCPVQELSIV